ncbi:hypothetical protein CRE_21802 [Caenorhabditis remanei]|uniref:Uncharacterized protein n=1 Tax=Caenorhabditis remanei TaxID=31234 RepID=E3MEJ9_CAERE|nr:hypothetical protein CRE_21802 [Caenorhabditis remanei]
MKMQLRIVLLLALGVHFLHSVSLNDKEKKDKIDKLNEDRKKYAIKNGIGNMHELSYDMALQAKADSMSDCEIKNGDYVVVLDIKKEYWHILQTKIGCTILPRVCNTRDMPQGAELCLMGPHSYHATMDDKEDGGLGTRCPGKLAASGLCVSGSKSDDDKSTSNDGISKSLSTAFFLFGVYISALM